MLVALCLGLFLPLIGFLILMTTSSVINRRWAGWIGCSTILLSFLCFCTIFYHYTISSAEPTSFSLFNWISTKGIQTDFNLHLDTLSILMTLIITGVGFLIHVYSIGYMDHEKDFARYFACLNFFVFAMLLLVLAGNLLLLFVGWEGVGLASYLLIGFWYTRPAAAKAATKAFVVNRIGDLGLLLGILLTFYLFGTTDIVEISARATQQFAVGAPLITVLTLLYFWGATGKSAQIPLYTWLPDAMEGPTPVSALIHAATMVTAGVYLVVRMHSLFLLAPMTMNIVGMVGGITALFAALCAIGQTDLKRVLAYSTISQLGLMFLACGVGAFYAAMFHLTTHAFVKALLFLSAGNVVHMMHGTTDMDKMGGLSKIFTKTHWLFLIGVLALSGIPPLSAFFSKELILEQEYKAGYKVLFYVGLITSILTAFYLTRAYFLTFTGYAQTEEKLRNTIKEAPSVMLIPLFILAAFSIFSGFLGSSLSGTPPLEEFLEDSDVHLIGNEHARLIFHKETWMAIIGGLLGVGAAAWMYSQFRNRLRAPLAILKKAFFIDEIYDWLFVRPLKGLSGLIVHIFEPKFFDRSIGLTTEATQGVAALMQRMQSGQIRSYIAWMVLGTALLIVYFTFRGFHA